MQGRLHLASRERRHPVLSSYDRAQGQSVGTESPRCQGGAASLDSSLLPPPPGLDVGAVAYSLLPCVDLAFASALFEPLCNRGFCCSQSRMTGRLLQLMTKRRHHISAAFLAIVIALFRRVAACRCRGSLSLLTSCKPCTPIPCTPWWWGLCGKLWPRAERSPVCGDGLRRLSMTSGEFPRGAIVGEDGEFPRGVAVGELPRGVAVGAPERGVFAASTNPYPVSLFQKRAGAEVFPPPPYTVAPSAS